MHLPINSYQKQLGLQLEFIRGDIMFKSYLLMAVPIDSGGIIKAQPFEYCHWKVYSYALLQGAYQSAIYQLIR